MTARLRRFLRRWLCLPESAAERHARLDHKAAVERAARQSL